MMWKDWPLECEASSVRKQMDECCPQLELSSPPLYSVWDPICETPPCTFGVTLSSSVKLKTSWLICSEMSSGWFSTHWPFQPRFTARGTSLLWWLMDSVSCDPEAASSAWPHPTTGKLWKRASLPQATSNTRTSVHNLLVPTTHVTRPSSKVARNGLFLVRGKEKCVVDLKVM